MRGMLQVVWALGVGILVTELLLRLFAPIPDPHVRRDVAITVNQTLPGLTPRIVYERDADGLRSGSLRPGPKPERTLRVLALGASTTDQPTQETAATWPGLLEARLRAAFADSGLRIEVAALGTGGGKTVLHRLAFCSANLGRLEPDVVVTLEGINDLFLHGGPGYEYDDTIRAEKVARYAAESPGRPPASKEWMRRLAEHSQIGRRLPMLAMRIEVWRGRALEWHSRYLPRRWKKYRKLPYEAAPERDPDPIAEFSEGIALLLDCIGDAGARAVVLGQPTLWKEQMLPEEEAVLWLFVDTPDGRVRADTAWMAAEMHRYNEVQREQALRHDARYLDLGALVPKTRKVFFDDCHFTDHGNRVVAEKVFPVVREALEEAARARAGS